MKIGVLSDTHGYLHPRVLDFFREADEIWHAGDIGSLRVLESLEQVKPVRAVYGNIDGQDLRIRCPQVNLFTAENFRVLIIHIGGYPGKYNPSALRYIEKERPGILVCGHSHILKVQYDHQYNLLYINPGAAGKFGSHKSITAIRFKIWKGTPSDMEVLDIT